MRRIGVARESPGWAFVSAIGASFFASAVIQLLAFIVYPLLFPPTHEQVIYVSPRVIWEGAGAMGAGAVAVRAGGFSAALLYVAFQIALLAAQIPARTFACARVAAFNAGACDWSVFLGQRWTLWFALALGIAASRWLAPREREENTVLRAAGAYGFVFAAFASVGSMLLFLAVLPNTPINSSGPFPIVTPTEVPLYATALGEIIGAVLAGVLLARRSLAPALLIALLLIGPSFANGVPLWRAQSNAMAFPLPMWVGMFAWLWSPLIAVLALFIAWALARKRNLLLAPM